MAAQMRFRVALALVAVCLVWGSTYYAIRVSIESFPPFLMGGIRFLCAGAVLYAALRLRGSPRLTAREWLNSAKVGFLLLAVSNGAVTYSEQVVSSSIAAVIVATMPLWAVLFARLWGDSPRRGEIAGLVLGFAGVAILHAGGELFGHGLSTLALLVAPAAWALGSVWSKRLALPAGGMAAAAQMLTGGLVMTVFGLARGERMPESPSVRSIVAVAYLVVFGSLVAFSAYGYLLRNTRPSTATAYAYVNPIVAVILGVALAGESLTWPTVVGTAVILGGVVVLRKATKKIAPAAAPDVAPVSTGSPASAPSR